MRAFPQPTRTNRNARYSSQGKRAFRGRHPPLQAHHREGRHPHRTARPRVLREAHLRAQAQACRRRQAPPQAYPQPDPAAEALLSSPPAEFLPKPPHGEHAGGFGVFASGETAMSLKIRIVDDMKTAMKARETARLGAIRLLMAAMKQKEVDERIELDDAGVVAIIEKMLKQRRDSITQYEAGKRQDLADAEKFEVQVLTAY